MLKLNDDKTEFNVFKYKHTTINTFAGIDVWNGGALLDVGVGVPKKMRFF